MPSVPTGPTVGSYRIAGYQDGLVGGASPECDLLRPHYDSGLKWPDPDNPRPEDPLWGAGVRGGITWDGTFYRDLTRYPAGGQFFWSAYLKPGTGPGIKNGYWLNFGSGWCHLANDDPSQVLSGAAPRLFYDVGCVPSRGANGGTNAASGDAAYSSGRWKLVIEANMFVTYAVVNVWTGIKAGGNDPAGVYTRLSGCDSTPSLFVEAC
jgi:hypothetical protein